MDAITEKSYTPKNFLENYKIIILNIDRTTSFFAEYLKEINETWLSVESKNQDRHRLIKVNFEDKIKCYYLLFKQAPFYSFDKQFEDSKNEINGYGESINEEWLNYAISKNCSKIIVVYPNGFIYGIEPKIWKNYAVANNLIRITDAETNQLINGNLIKASEKIYSIPLKIIKRLNVNFKAEKNG